MRKIKFRAFCKSENRMLSYEHLKEATKGMVDVANAMIEKRCIRVTKPSPYGLFLPLEDEDLEFMQFTGLHDKNGKEIYEGDIVKVKLTQKEDINLYETKYKIGFVAYDENFCLFYLKNNFMKFINWAFNNINGKEIEVIGNIYDNPELLGGK